MPSAAEFKHRFGLTVGSAVGSSLQIAASHVGHVVERENERYSFPTELVLSSEGAKASPKSVAAAFAANTRAKQNGIVHSAYGSPYECTISAGKAKPSGKDSNWTLMARGLAIRRRDLPTLAQQRAAERAAEEPGKDALAALQPEYRIIRSRFGTSKCVLW